MIIIADSRGWFSRSLSRQEADANRWSIITSREELHHEHLSLMNPSHIFFAHWSWIVPEEIYENFNCIVFHTAPLPYGRGGSPNELLPPLPGFFGVAPGELPPCIRVHPRVYIIKCIGMCINVFV